ALPDTDPAPGQSKTLWTTISVATPVVLTVFATVLAGLSSSEMTLAQYHRSMAAQNQSKASDQWSFFQAKRIRGSEAQRTVRLLQALSEPGQIQPDSLGSTAAVLLQQLQQLRNQADRLQEAIASAQSDLGSSALAAHQAADLLKASASMTVRSMERAM